MIDVRDVQGNILNGYRFEHARYLFVRFPDGIGNAQRCLADLVPSVTAGARSAPIHAALNVAITYAGFDALGVEKRVLDKFPDVFRVPPRTRAGDLGDTGASRPAGWDDHLGTGDVHAIVTVHANDAATVQGAVTGNATVLVDQRAHQLTNKREHFGFADGGAQPDLEGVAPHRPGGGVPMRDGTWRPVRLGEFLLGHPNEDGDTVDAPDASITRNGSYLVVRKLHQDVALFRRALGEAANRTGLAAELIAAKLIGRWRDGLPVGEYPDRVVGDLTHTQTDAPNDFRYLPSDRRGFGCPVGAHVRRANPRDSLTFDGFVRDGGELTARHRIIRRAMPYGDELPDDVIEDDGVDRGLMFVCYNADIERQFETVQRQWCNGGDIFGLGADRDPLFSVRGGKTTVPRDGAPPLFLPAWPDLVTTRGAEYAFAPSISALRRLAAR